MTAIAGTGIGEVAIDHRAMGFPQRAARPPINPVRGKRLDRPDPADFTGRYVPRANACGHGHASGSAYFSTNARSNT
ncbi:hypothetical protein [Stenotrophomonas sp. YIM B06876]|uniref:hypothetical protein n=1 Tax=Stenotrophomonas sp. YIM B06876 TaxID=3060211 RepID=UPI002738B3A6|nr:hypothetical protein [Stenotrophomonas sp. YIM B06876]